MHKDLAKDTSLTSSQLFERLGALFGQEEYQQALSLAHFNMKHLVDLLPMAGAAADRLNNPVKAENYFRAAVCLRPDSSADHYNLGKWLHGQQRLEEAENAYRQAIVIKADYAEAFNNLGLLLQEQHRLDEAEETLRRAIARDPKYVQAHFNLGMLLGQADRLEEAESCYRQVVALRPDHASALSNIGLLLHEQKRFGEAELWLKKAIAADEQHFAAYNNLGLVLQHSKRFTESENAHRQAIAIKPDYAQAYSNLGLLMENFRRFKEAEQAYRQALAIQADYANAKWNLSLLLLGLGCFSEGWSLYEARLDLSRKEMKQMLAMPHLPFPRWQGEALQGKSLLVCVEQGFGDEMQFIRLLPLLTKLGIREMTLLCTPQLHRLFAGCVNVDRLILKQDAANITPPDFWTPLLSLPLRLGITLETIPADLPYLSVPEELSKSWSKLLPQQGLKVGLVWKGSTNHKRDADRSLPGLATLAPLWDIADVSFVSLQKGQGEEEAANPLPGQPIVHFNSQIKDFADTAAIVSQLDLVISVDTSVVHLAGALNKPCWVLLPFYGVDWRWMHDGADSPWYPEVLRLFRQQRDGDWSHTIEQVADELKGLRRQL